MLRRLVGDDDDEAEQFPKSDVESTIYARGDSLGTMPNKSKLPEAPLWGSSFVQFTLAVGAAVIIMSKKPF